MKHRIGIFVPARNVAATILKVLERIPKSVLETSEVLVIDNASSDGTGNLVLQYAKHSPLKLRLYRTHKNVGYGGSQKSAFALAIDEGYDALAILHGDGQYPAELLPLILGPVVNNEADFCFGSRITGKPLEGSMGLIRYWGNRFLTRLQNKIADTQLSEWHTGFRAFRCDALSKIPFQMCSDYYDMDTEVTLQFALKKLRIREVTIPTLYNRQTQSMPILPYIPRMTRTLAQATFHQLGLIACEKYNTARSFEKDSSLQRLMQQLSQPALEQDGLSSGRDTV